MELAQEMLEELRGRAIRYDSAKEIRSVAVAMSMRGNDCEAVDQVGNQQDGD